MQIDSITEAFTCSRIPQLFVHCLSSVPNLKALKAVAPGIEKYPERSLLLAEPTDLVAVLDGVEPSYLQYLSNFRIGPPPENVIGIDSNHRVHCSLPDLLQKDRAALSGIGNWIRQKDKIILHPFVVSSAELQLADFLKTEFHTNVQLMGGTPTIVEIAGSKHSLKEKAILLRIPVAAGDVFEMQGTSDGKRLRSAIQRNIIRTGKVMIRGSSGHSGSSTFIIDSSAENIGAAAAKITAREDNHIYMVEPMFDVIVSPNVLMFIGLDGSIRCVGITDQILNEAMLHEGNRYPSRAKMLEPMMDSSMKIAEWLRSDGYTGLFGLDFAEYMDRPGGERKYFLAEVNPRMNAAGYSKALMERLNYFQQQKEFPQIKAFISINTKTEATSFAQLQEIFGDMFFQPETGNGLVPYNTGCLKYGKFTAAIFGKSEQEVDEQMHVLTQRHEVTKKC
jgi:hypothetical protein